MNHFRLYDPEAEHVISAKSSLSEFFEEWYVPTVTETRRRKPPSPATLKRYRERLVWWTKLMATRERPFGPLLGEITDDSLAEFAERLTDATWTRGVEVARLTPASQFGVINDLLGIIRSAGPRQGRKVRANILADPPSLFIERPRQFPKGAWTLAEARQLVASIATVRAPLRWPGSKEGFRQLLRASIALLYYTGERANTVFTLGAEALDEGTPDEVWLNLANTVKTNRLRRVAVHPQLHEQLRRLRVLVSGERLIPWPTKAWDTQHDRLQDHAGVRRFPLQAWRRLHSRSIEQTGFRLAQQMAQESLGHSSVAVTSASYTASLDSAILLMPTIF